MANGILTQALNNLLQTEATIRSFQGLPDSAVSIQRNAEQVVDQLVPQIRTLQTDTQSVGQRLQSQIQGLLANFDQASPQQIKDSVSQMQAEAGPLSQQLQTVQQACFSSNNQLANDSQQLQAITAQLQANIAGLQSNLAGAQQELDALNKKKLYLIGLGILGLPGLIAMAVLLSQAQDKVNDLEGQVKSLQSQINQQQSFRDQTSHFSGDMSDLIDKVGKINNSLQFVSSDLVNALNDLDQNNKAAAKVFLTAASMEINTMLQDAS
ncbi:hypothetical protein BI343_16110 [Chromobacterium amazonense]|uniref:hypothetical protein n=1 Tax=Chromobacterium amazonense TaxID=1382803 RepID=UPI0008DB3270|nr:hypothetical protein [Chromobacterium amazonense]OHX16098.1 hypothetical protein BI343_16110 [Chromobacterium amazonense]